MDLAISKHQKMENTELQKLASLMFLRGAGRKDVIDFLAENGVEAAATEKMATDAYMAVKEQRKEIVEEQVGAQAATGGGSGGVISIVIGLVLMIGGIAATMASDSIFYGAIGVGAITFFQGLASRN